MKYRTFTFTGPASINLAKAWCEQYELDYHDFDSDRGTCRVTVKWPDAEFLTINQLLGRIRMLDRLLDRDKEMWKMWR